MNLNFKLIINVEILEVSVWIIRSLTCRRNISICVNVALVKAVKFLVRLLQISAIKKMKK